MRKQSCNLYLNLGDSCTNPHAQQSDTEPDELNIPSQCLGFAVV